MGSLNPDVSYKVLVLGATGVGKTSLLRLLSGRDQDRKIYTTVAPDFFRVCFPTPSAVIEFCLWDSPGEERFHSITKQQLSGVQAIVLVYSISDKTSFTHLETWLEILAQSEDRRHSLDTQLPKILIGNKTDLESERQVQKNNASTFSYSNLMVSFAEGSVKSGDDVHVLEAFKRLAEFMVEWFPPKQPVKLNGMVTKNKSIQDYTIGFQKKDTQPIELKEVQADYTEDDPDERCTCPCVIL